MGILEKLTEREQQVFLLLCRGLLNKEISADLHISLDTVKKHTKQIYKKLSVRNRTEATILFNTFPYQTHKPSK